MVTTIEYCSLSLRLAGTVAVMGAFRNPLRTTGLRKSVGTRRHRVEYVLCMRMVHETLMSRFREVRALICFAPNRWHDRYRGHPVGERFHPGWEPGCCRDFRGEPVRANWRRGGFCHCHRVDTHAETGRGHRGRTRPFRGAQWGAPGSASDRGQRKKCSLADHKPSVDRHRRQPPPVPD